MKIWQIKAMALRLMFVSTGLQYSEDEFRDKVVYSNGNTRDYLVRMEDSIRRAIDKYYEIVGETPRRKTFTYEYKDGKYLNRLNALSTEDFGFPSRIDFEVYDPDSGELRSKRNGVPFVFDQITKIIDFDEFDFTDLEDNIKFIVWYKAKKLNIPYDLDEMDYDVDKIHIPPEVQSMIPYFIKGELFEEDEPNLAQVAMNSYIRFLYGQRKPFGKVRTKVTRSKVFQKTN